MSILTNFEFFIPEVFLTINILSILLYSIAYANKSGSGIYRFKECIKTFSLINLIITLFILLFLKISFSFPFYSAGLLMSND
jgi:hypothetical protein